MADPASYSVSLSTALRGFIEGMHKTLRDTSAADFERFRFSRAVNEYLESQSLVPKEVVEALLKNLAIHLKNLAAYTLLEQLKGSKENVEHYISLHRDVAPQQAAKDYFENNPGDKTRNLVLLSDIYSPAKDNLCALLNGQKDALADRFARGQRNDREARGDSIREIYDALFEQAYGTLSSAPAAESFEASAPTPANIRENVLARERHDITSPAATVGPGGEPIPPAIVDQAWRGGGLYAFTWWKVAKDDAKKLRDGNHYPRNRGDLKPGYTETPNKHLTNLLAGLGGKEEGRVDGYYLGWMGLSKKGVLEGKADGQDVVKFELKEDEVVMLGVAKITKFDLMRLRFNGFSGWWFDWSVLHWKWDVWDGAAKKDDPGSVQVRVVQWADADDKGYLKDYLLNRTHISYSYEDVMDDQNIIHQFFDDIFNSKKIGVDGASVEQLQPGATHSSPTLTLNDGHALFSGLQPSLDIEFVAGKKGFKGISLPSSGFAEKAAIAYPFATQSSFNPDTGLPRRYLKVGGTNQRVLLILQTEPKGELGEPELLLNPVTKQKNHAKPLLKEFGSDEFHFSKLPVNGEELSFHVIKQNRSQPVPNDQYWYYLFLASVAADDAPSIPLPPTAVDKSVVTIVFKRKDQKLSGLYQAIHYEKGGQNYWGTGGGNETVTASFTPHDITPGRYRLYCLLAKKPLRNVDGLARKDQVLKGEDYAGGDLWDYNFIEFMYGAATLKERNKKYEEFKKQLRALEHIDKKGDHKLLWETKEQLEIIQTLWTDINEVVEGNKAVLLRLGQNANFITAKKLMFYCLVNGKKNAKLKELDLGRFNSKKNKEIAAEYDSSLGNYTLEQLIEKLEWLMNELNAIYEGK